jgi:hypothetical protein
MWEYFPHQVKSGDAAHFPLRGSQARPHGLSQVHGGPPCRFRGVESLELGTPPHPKSRGLAVMVELASKGVWVRRGSEQPL